MENDESKEKLRQFLFNMAVTIIILGVLAFLLFLLFKLQFGFAMFLVSLITTLVGSYLRTPSIGLRRIDLLTTNKPNEIREKHIAGVEASKTPKYGRQDLLFFSGLLGLAFSLPYICGLMFA